MRFIILTIVAAVSGAACAQEIIPDSAVLDLGESRNDFACIVAPIQPELGFDLRYHSGYAVSIPMKELEDGITRLTLVFRVFPKNQPKQPVYFLQKIRIPQMQTGARGRANFEGAFRLGQGEYHVDWLMRDQNGRLCANSWDLQAKPMARDNIAAESVIQNLVEADDPTLFANESPIYRRPGNAALHVKIIVNFASQNKKSASLSTLDLEGLAGILRTIAREPRIVQYSLVALSIQSQQVVYRQDAVASIDLPALGKALQSLNLGTVDVKHLMAKNSESEFLEHTMTEEFGRERVDAVIFVGPKYYVDPIVPQAIVDRMDEIAIPVFYLNYNSHPIAKPWRDAIGKLVRQLHGYEYAIGRPQDLSTAWADVMSRMAAKNPAWQTSRSTF